MSTTETHPLTKHGCQPLALKFSASGPTAFDATVHLNGRAELEVVRASVTYEVGEFAAVEVEYDDGTVDTYEAHEASIEIDAWPVCPTGEHRS